MKLGIVGLGLMGGSFALDFKSIYPKSKIYGLDISNENENRAIDLGLVSPCSALRGLYSTPSKSANLCTPSSPPGGH